MSTIDIILGGLLVFGLIKGILNGFFVELASLFSFVIGIYLASKFSYIVGNALGASEGSSRGIKIISFMITFLVVVVGIYFLAKVFSKLSSLVFLGWLNKLLGGLFGVMRITLYAGVCLSLLTKISSEMFSKETQQESLFYQPITKTSKLIFPVIEQTFETIKKV